MSNLARIWMPSPNHSPRAGAAVRMIVLHTAEGANTIQSLGAFFSRSSTQASSHVGADDTPGTIGEYVRRDQKAWTVASYNPVSVNIELCAFADWDAAEWARHPVMLANCAAWIAEEAAHYNIPIVALTPAEAQGSGRGVAQHKDLGQAGGGHHDCGPAFPIGQVLAMARGAQPAPGPEPTPTPPEDTMAIAATQNADGRLAVFVELKDGSVKHCEQAAPNGDWWKDDKGQYKWLGLGNPSK